MKKIIISGLIIVIAIVAYFLILQPKEAHPTQIQKFLEVLEEYDKESSAKIPKNTDGEDPLANCEIPGLKIDQEIAVFVVGGNSGAHKIDVPIDKSGHLATRSDIAVNYTKTPVALILGAYQPTIWNISWTSGTNIVAVLGTGYYTQQIAGINVNVPTLISTFVDKGTCGSFYFHHNQDDPNQELNDLNLLSNHLFKSPVNKIYLTGDTNENGLIPVGDQITSKLNLITNTSLPPESFYTDELVGIAGLEILAERGLLRKATKEDVEVFSKLLEGHYKIQDYNSYIILGSFTYPSGLVGGNSATFFLPAGVEEPTGDWGHSVIYNLETKECIGSTCTTYSL